MVADWFVIDSYLKSDLFYFIVSILAGNIWGRNGAVIGWTEKGGVGSEVGVEVDLRSSKKEERAIRFIIDGKIQKCVIAGVGKEVRFGVCNSNPIYFYFLLFADICFFIYLLGYTSSVWSNWIY